MGRGEMCDHHVNEEEAERTRYSLLGRIKNWDDAESWQEFFDVYWKLIHRTASHSGLTASEVSDVVQETILSVAKGIAKFRCDPSAGSFKAWLLKVTRRRIVDQYRKRPPFSCQTPQQNTAGRKTDLIERLPDPNQLDLDTIWEAQWEGNLLDAALERMKRRVKPAQFQLFDLNVTKNWPVSKICEKLGVSRTQVYLAKHRISRLLKKEVHNLRTNYR